VFLEEAAQALVHGDKCGPRVVLAVPAVLDQLLVACRQAVRHVRPRAVEYLVQDLHMRAHAHMSAACCYHCFTRVPDPEDQVRRSSS
jgi:hypothetical protein